MHRVVPHLVLLVTVASCAPNVRPASPTVATAAGVTMPADRLRIESMEAGRRFASRVERVAEAIQDSTTDRRIWRHAQTWKINATQAAQDAVFRFEPLVSFLDLYALAVQQRTFFATPPGDTLFGPYQPAVVASVNGIRDDLRQYLLTVLPDDREGRLIDTVEAWAARFPITTEQFTRYSVEGVAARLISADETSVFSAVGSMEQTVRTLDGRVAMMQSSLPKSARWQAELLTRDLLPGDARDSVVRSLSQITAAVDRISLTAGELPGLVTGERQAVLDAVSAERALVVEAITAEREAVLAAIALGGQATLAAVDAQRRAFLIDLEAATLRIKEATIRELAVVVDDAIKKVALLIVLPTLLGIALLILALAWILRPRAA
jgi:hypothetical protein